MRDLTIELDEMTLQRAEQAAERAGRSLPEWAAGLIERAVGPTEMTFEEARRAALEMMERGFDLGGNYLTRDEAHER